MFSLSHCLTLSLDFSSCSYENFDSGHSDNNEQPGPARVPRVTLAWKGKKEDREGEEDGNLHYSSSTSDVDRLHSHKVSGLYLFIFLPYRKKPQKRKSFHLRIRRGKWGSLCIYVYCIKEKKEKIPADLILHRRSLSVNGSRRKKRVGRG